MWKYLIRFAIKKLKTLQDKELKRELLAESVKHLYNAIGPEDILHQTPKGEWFFMGKPLTGVEVANLRNEATMIRGMKLWYVIKQDIRYHLGRKMFEEARVVDDVVWGQLLTYLDEVIRNRLQKM